MKKTTAKLSPLLLTHEKKERLLEIARRTYPSGSTVQCLLKGRYIDIPLEGIIDWEIADKVKDNRFAYFYHTKREDDYPAGLYVVDKDVKFRMLLYNEDDDIWADFTKPVSVQWEELKHILDE